MSAFDTLAEWFTKSERTLPQRLITILIIVLCVYLANDLLGFAYYYRVNKKVENFCKLTEIINSEKIDSCGRADAMNLRHTVVMKEPYSFTLFNFLTKSWGLKSRKKSVTPPRTVTTTKTAANMSIRNDLLFLASASGIFVLLGLVLIPVLMFSSDYTVSQRIGGVIVALIIFGLVTIALNSLMNLIPTLGNNWNYNYILNATIQITLIIVIIFAITKSRNPDS
ncbi:hypothetical protein [Chitinophaga filiformis]|uniref:Uncharacterized protein n=1 Tax=Chitinophaga filiformis TaxID=104663 RepID=A0A1G7LXK8_CHIFI|nr:hypothetical protein [Chitinophaga filiformis]SDF54136.1 hypothetical protein SAMN04488121_102221 [Chitinophaga filiformis]